MSGKAKNSYYLLVLTSRKVYIARDFEGIMKYKIKESLKRKIAPIFIASATIGLPVLSELTGASEHVRQRMIELQRGGYTHMLENSNYENKEINGANIQRNIDYIDEHRNSMNESARYGINAFASIVGFAGSSCAVAAKRKFDEMWGSSEGEKIK